MNVKIRCNRYVPFLLLVGLLVHFPVIFTKAKVTVVEAKGALKTIINEPNTPASPVAVLANVYDSLNLQAKGLSEEAFRAAISGYSILKSKGKLAKTNLLTIIDFTKSSAKKRLFVIDVNNYRLLVNTYVAHGQNSGEEYATNFSNKNESLASSLGFFITKGTYMGENGFSMQLEGMEPGFNDQAFSRSIVMHGADYVNENWIRSRGYIGRSWGCPAVSQAMNPKIIEKIKGGSCFFIYSNNKAYNKKSKLAHAV